MLQEFCGVTVIVPNYNHARFLTGRLQSIYGQDYPNLKVILLDDASTDDSHAILESYRSHPRTQAVEYNAVNSGSPFGQWQKGIQMAETEWVWIAESDDTCAPGFLEALLPGLQQPGCVLAFNELHWINEAGDITRNVPERPAFLMDGLQFVRTAMVPRNRLLNAGMVVVRRSTALGINARWAAYRKSGDYRFFTDVARQGKVYGSGKPLAFYRRHSQQVTAKLENEDINFTEKFETWQFLVNEGTLLPLHLAPVIRMRLVENEILRKIRGNADYARIQSHWLSFAKSIGIPVHPVTIKAEALLSKARHFIRNLNSKGYNSK